jgi:hypothetical protein
MSIEKKVNNYGQEQIIDNFDKIIKIGNNFLQVRLIKTKRWKERNLKNGRFTEPMPRAKFINPKEDFYYLVNRRDLIEMKKRSNL